MAILGTPLTKEVLDTKMKRLSTQIHKLMHEIVEFNAQMAEVSDGDLEALYTAAGSADAATDRADFRSWLVAAKALADNYAGQGAVLNRAFEIAKRVDPLL